jgi:hypothetical protein
MALFQINPAAGGLKGNSTPILRAGRPSQIPELDGWRWGIGFWEDGWNDRDFRAPKLSSRPGGRPDASQLTGHRESFGYSIHRGDLARKYGVPLAIISHVGGNARSAWGWHVPIARKGQKI